MKKIEAKFKVHNVGQVFFYSGVIARPNLPNFNMVYDCGSVSESSVKKAVSEYIREFTPDKIDMLVISHFDMDHVSDVKELISNPKISGFSSLFIPYYTKTFDQKKCSLFLLDILLAMYSTETMKKIKNIVLVPNHAEEGKIINFENRRKQDFYAVIEEKRMESNGFINISDKTLAKCTELPEKTDIVLSGEWMFDFFNLGIDDTEISAFNSKIEVYLKQNKCSNLIDLLSREDNRVHLSKIKEIYEETLGGKGIPKNDCCNNTSLCVFHGPKSEMYPLFEDMFCSSMDYFHNHICVRQAYITENYTNKNFMMDPYYNWAARGNLLTGDIDLKVDKRMKEFNNHFSIRKGDTKYLFLPHHGSEKNWNNELLEYCSSTGVSCVTSSGKNSSYGHPSKEVVSKVRNRLISVNECESFTYEYGNWLSFLEYKNLIISNGN